MVACIRLPLCSLVAATCFGCGARVGSSEAVSSDDAEVTTTPGALQRSFVTNGSVRAITVTDTGVYLGGSLSYVGPRNGSWVVLDEASGVVDKRFPEVGGGSAYCSAPDGAGGYFIGGDFRKVGNRAVERLAHVLADGSVDATFRMPANGVVRSCVYYDGKLYIGGDFGVVGGETRFRLAALDGVSGAVTAWNPNFANASIEALAVTDSKVYAGGVTRTNPKQGVFLSIDRLSGAVTQGSVDRAVHALELSEGVLYVGGEFTSFAGSARNAVAAIQVASAALLPWNPQVFGSYVAAIDRVGASVYLGGSFNFVGSTSRANLAAVDATTGSLLPWHVDVAGTVSALVANDSGLYLGGKFSNVAGVARQNFARVELGTGSVSDVPRNASAPVRSLLETGSRLAVAGDFGSVNGESRSNAAAIDRTSRQALDWKPRADGEVSVLASSGTSVYLGGSFSRVSGQARSRLAAADAISGALLPWDPEITPVETVPGSIAELLPNGSSVLVGGFYALIGGSIRPNLAAVDATSGGLMPWLGDAWEWGVYALARDGNTLYVGGDLGRIGNQPRANLGALDLTTGAATSLNPQTNDPVYDLLVHDGVLYAAGAFTTISGQHRERLAALNLDGSLRPLQIDFDSEVYALAAKGDLLVVGGAFKRVNGGTQRFGLAAINLATGALSNFAPEFDGAIRALAIRDNSLYVGGSFTRVGRVQQSGFAEFNLPSP